ncbi:MAG: sensor histidine kinase [Acidobacteriota bacterium]
MINSYFRPGKRTMLALCAALTLSGLLISANSSDAAVPGFSGAGLPLASLLHGAAFACACVAALAMESAERARERDARIKSEQRLNALIQAIPSQVCFQDTAGRWLVVNQAMQEAAGLDATALIGKTATEINALSPNAGFIDSTVLQTDELAWKEGEVRYCVSFRRQDGGESTLDVLKKTLEHSGRQVGLMVLRQDVTSSRRAMEELRTANAELKAVQDGLEARVASAIAENRRKDLLLVQQARLAAMGEMIGNIAHQWRQPLNALGLLMANLTFDAKSGAADSAEFDRYAAHGQDILTSMSRTIDDFRNFFKPDKEQKTFQVCEPVQEALSLMEASLAQAGISVERHLDQPVTIRGYKGEFSQVVLNLLANARDAIRDTGMRHGDIRVSVTGQDGIARIQVADSGGGVPEENMTRIFEPYFTTKPQDKGTGLGLYMSKRIIEDHMQGRLTIFNDDSGAVFTISVPMAPSEAIQKDDSPCS